VRLYGFAGIDALIAKLDKNGGTERSQTGWDCAGALARSGSVR
jgi:hypothetical protein